MTFRIAAVIPCYNTGTICLDIIRRTQAVADLVVAINDGSGDDTAVVLAQSGATILTHSINQGKGAALRTGFSYLLTREDWEAAATLDADGQHDPAFLPKLADPIGSGLADMVIGSRQFQRQGMPFARWLANRTSSYLISKRLRIPVMDIQSGYRVFSRKLLQSLLPRLSAVGFEIETEMLIAAVREKARVTDRPIPAIYLPDPDHPSHWRGIRDSVRIMRILLKSRA